MFPSFFRAGLLLALYFAAPLALAGNIHFGMARVDNRLQLTNVGNSSAYHPQVFRLLADGHWQPLAPLPGQAPRVELAPKQPLELLWPGAAPGQPDPAAGQFGPLLPVMVRFFDQAGVGFGQLSFFSSPPITATPIVAAYRAGALEIQPPADRRIKASWLLWAQEEGISPLAAAVDYTHRQPPARRFDWQNAPLAQRVPTGAAQPVALLLHETDAGFEMQPIPGGGLQGLEQRPDWLKASPGFYKLALIALFFAAALLLRRGLVVWRSRRATPQS